MSSALILFQQIVFIGILIGFGLAIFQRARFILEAIRLGKPDDIDKETHSERLKKTLLLAFGQRKLFEKPLVGILHFTIYAGFLLINIEVLEIVLDGILGTHRLFLPWLGGAYGFLVSFFEFMALGVTVSCIVFFARRNAWVIPRFRKPEMQGWPTRDANIILVWEILLMGLLP